PRRGADEDRGLARGAGRRHERPGGRPRCRPRRRSGPGRRLRDVRGHAVHPGRRPDARRPRLHQGPPGRAVVPLRRDSLGPGLRPAPRALPGPALTRKRDTSPMSYTFTLSKPLQEYSETLREWSATECRPYARQADLEKKRPDNWK